MGCYCRQRFVVNEKPISDVLFNNCINAEFSCQCHSGKIYRLIITRRKRKRNVKSFPSHKAHRAALISRFLSPQPDTSLHCKTKDMGSASRGLPVYVPAFAGTHCACPRRDGQAGLIWVAGYIPIARGTLCQHLHVCLMANRLYMLVRPQHYTKSCEQILISFLEYRA